MSSVKPDGENMGVGANPSGLLGGVVVDTGRGFAFVPAQYALRIVPSSAVAHVPGSPAELLGVTLHEGVIVPVLTIGENAGPMIVCEVLGAVIALVGGAIVRSGTFEPDPAAPDAVLVDGTRAPTLDLPGLYDRVDTHRKGPRKGAPSIAKERVS